MIVKVGNNMWFEVERDIYDILNMRLVGKYGKSKKEIKIVAIKTKYTDIDVGLFTKISVHLESRLLATMQEDGNTVWLRYYKFESEEVFKEFLRKLL